MQTSSEGVFACGNVVHVNDLVDNVSVESMKAGKFAAQYAMGTLPKTQNVVQNISGENVRYLCPHSLSVAEENEKVSLYFRVLHPDNKVTIRVKSGDQIISSKKAQRVNPGEMEHIEFNTSDVAGDNVVVEVVKEA
jgi:hypothetical protein